MESLSGRLRAQATLSVSALGFEPQERADRVPQVVVGEGLFEHFVNDAGVLELSDRFRSSSAREEDDRRAADVRDALGGAHSTH